MVKPKLFTTTQLANTPTWTLSFSSHSISLWLSFSISVGKLCVYKWMSLQRILVLFGKLLTPPDNKIYNAHPNIKCCILLGGIVTVTAAVIATILRYEWMRINIIRPFAERLYYVAWVLYRSTHSLCTLFFSSFLRLSTHLRSIKPNIVDKFPLINCKKVNKCVRFGFGR